MGTHLPAWSSAATWPVGRYVALSEFFLLLSRYLCLAFSTSFFLTCDHDFNERVPFRLDLPALVIGRTVFFFKLHLLRWNGVHDERAFSF